MLPCTSTEMDGVLMTASTDLPFAAVGNVAFGLGHQYTGHTTGADTRPEDVADTLWEAAIFRLTTLENEKDVARNR